MKSKKLPLIAALTFATLFMIACGDNKDPRVTDRGAACANLQAVGGTCNPNGSGTSVTTATTTVSSTVTVTQTQ